MSVTIWEVLALCATHALPEEKSTRPTKHEKNGSQELTFSSNSQKEIVFEIRIHFHANRINILQYNWFNLSKILVVRSTYTGYPQDFNIFPTSFHHALDMELQTGLGHTLNLTGYPQEFDMFPISFHHALDMDLQTLLGHTLKKIGYW